MIKEIADFDSSQSKSFSSRTTLPESRNSYLINNPFKPITGFGFATPPATETV